MRALLAAAAGGAKARSATPLPPPPPPPPRSPLPPAPPLSPQPLITLLSDRRAMWWVVVMVEGVEVGCAGGLWWLAAVAANLMISLSHTTTEPQTKMIVLDCYALMTHFSWELQQVT